MDQQLKPNPLIVTPLHSVEQASKSTHHPILYLLRALESTYLEALPHLLWLERPLLPLWWHNTIHTLHMKQQHNISKGNIFVFKCLYVFMCVGSTTPLQLLR